MFSQKPDATNNEIEPTNLVEIAEKASLSGSSILRAIDAGIIKVLDMLIGKI